MSQCTHSRQRVTVKISQCEICGKVEQKRVREGIGAPPVQQITQGITSAGLIITSLNLSGADAAYLLSIEPCKHPEAFVTGSTCEHSKMHRKTCTMCGRVWSVPITK